MAEGAKAFCRGGVRGGYQAKPRARCTQANRVQPAHRKLWRKGNPIHEDMCEGAHFALCLQSSLMNTDMKLAHIYPATSQVGKSLRYSQTKCIRYLSQVRRMQSSELQRISKDMSLYQGARSSTIWNRHNSATLILIAECRRRRTGVFRLARAA